MDAIMSEARFSEEEKITLFSDLAVLKKGMSNIEEGLSNLPCTNHTEKIQKVELNAERGKLPLVLSIVALLASIGTIIRAFVK